MQASDGGLPQPLLLLELLLPGCLVSSPSWAGLSSGSTVWGTSVLAAPVVAPSWRCGAGVILVGAAPARRS